MQLKPKVQQFISNLYYLTFAWAMNFVRDSYPYINDCQLKMTDFVALDSISICMYYHSCWVDCNLSHFLIAAFWLLVSFVAL